MAECGRQSQFRRTSHYVKLDQSSEKLPVMIRSISLVVAALLGALWGGDARAQMSQADLLTRIDRLEAALRDLTGTVEQLQYRNQQLEQQLRALQDATATGARPPASPQPQPSPRPTGQYSPPPAAPPPAPVIAAAPPPAPVEPEPPRTGPPRRRVQSGAQSGCTRRAASARHQHGSDRTAAAGCRGATRRSRSTPAGRAARSVQRLRAAATAAAIRYRRAGRRIAAAATEQSERHRRHAGDAAAE